MEYSKGFNLYWRYQKEPDDIVGQYHIYIHISSHVCRLLLKWCRVSDSRLRRWFSFINEKSKTKKYYKLMTNEWNQSTDYFSEYSVFCFSCKVLFLRVTISCVCDDYIVYLNIISNAMYNVEYTICNYWNCMCGFRVSRKIALVFQT